MKHFYWLAVLGFGIWFLGRQLTSLIDSEVYIVFCNVGQGDATLISRGRVQILVDGGPNGKVLACLSRYMPQLDRQIELVINTHPEQDHIGGLPAVLRRFRVGAYVTGAVAGSNQAFTETKREIESGNIPVWVPQVGDVLRLGGLTLEILWPDEQPGRPGKYASLGSFSSQEGGLNKLSVVSVLRYGSFSLLLTGDIEAKQEIALSAGQVLTPVTVLKVAHHGSKTSTTSEFLALVKPQLAVVEVGQNNRYGHPNLDTLMHLETVGAKILRTDVEGDIRLKTDGINFWRIK